MASRYLLHVARFLQKATLRVRETGYVRESRSGRQAGPVEENRVGAGIFSGVFPGFFKNKNNLLLRSCLQPWLSDLACDDLFCDGVSFQTELDESAPY